jgi:uncharacterized pyridoxal phosphate-containing UPF0001 family protein
MMTDAADIAHNLAVVKERMAQAARKAGRDPSQVRLIAVSKTHSLRGCRLLSRRDRLDFGENYAQELRDKSAALALVPVRWHFIGRCRKTRFT